mgnify:CR=1 FL=1|jgi:uncharacterized C2H2 Zn-finger protein
MEQKIKCPYCAHIFNLKEAKAIHKKDINSTLVHNKKPEDFIICPSCNSWLDKSYLKFEK